MTFFVIPALAAALIGQLRSLWVTLIAGFVIGLVQSCLTAFSDLAQYRTMTPFVLAIIALLWFARPDSRRCGHEHGRERGGLVVEVEHSVDAAATRSGFMGRARDLAVSPTQVIAIAVLLVVAFVAVPAFLDSYWLLVMTGVVIYSIITLGLGVLIGRVGMVSLCQFVLAAYGAWVALRLELRDLAPLPRPRPHRRAHHRGHRRR